MEVGWKYSGKGRGGMNWKYLRKETVKERNGWAFLKLCNIIKRADI